MHDAPRAVTGALEPDDVPSRQPLELDDVLAADAWARERARTLVSADPGRT